MVVTVYIEVYARSRWAGDGGFGVCRHEPVMGTTNVGNTSGDYNVRWSTSNVPSGIYFYRLEAADGSMTRRMTVIK